MSAPFELRAQFRVIVDLPIEDDHRVAVFRPYGLVAGIQVDDFQAGRAKRDQVGLEDALLVGAAMYQRMDGALYPAGTGHKFELSKAGDSTQNSLPLERWRAPR